ncbi:MAG: glycosyltransferase [Anaerolineae bacterium]|nr:glycosyltransferase [Anaerolineae bacterium]
MTETIDRQRHPAPDTPPRVSIGLPVYNGERFIGQAIEALLTQTYRDFELIVCDNGSTDRTIDIIRQYAKRDPRLRFYQNPHNLGWWGNYNRAFELATGEFFMWNADDDLRAPTFIERCLAPLEHDPWAILCYAQTKLIDSQGCEIPRDAQRRGYYIDHAGNLLRMRNAEPLDKRLDSPHLVDRFRDIVLKTNFCHEQYGLIRREVLAKTNLMQNYYGSDKAMLAQLSLLGRFTSVPEPLFSSRRHIEQSSNIVSARDRAIWSGATTKLKNSLRPRTMVFQGCLEAALKTPMTPSERIACVWIVLRYLTVADKWLMMFEEMTGWKKRKLLKHVS